MTDSNSGLQHRLAVVWFTDLVGWSSLASKHEDRAIALVRRFQAAVRAAVPSEAGRVVKFIGDAALVESPSAESALRSAAALRESMGEGSGLSRSARIWSSTPFVPIRGSRRSCAGSAWRSYRAGAGNATGLSLPSPETAATPKK